MSQPASMNALLDRHGYVLQLAIKTRVRELGRTRHSPWRIYAYELPVVAGQWTTRIDLVLHDPSINLYMACECKRTDPALAWFFARVPRFVSHKAVFDRLRNDESGIVVEPDTIGRVGDRPFHIGLVGNSGSSGDGTASGRDQIEEAVTQALKGAGGLVNRFVRDGYVGAEGFPRYVIPAVVTTSHLFVTEADITVGSLEDGRLPEEPPTEERSWLWYQYHASPHLLSDHVVAGGTVNNPVDAMLSEFTRSVAVIRASAIEEFFQAWT